MAQALSKRSVIFLSLFALFLGGIVFEILQTPSSVRAQTSASDIEILHTAADGRTLQAPGAFFPISLVLKNTKATDLSIRFIASSDGKLMDVAIPPGFLNPDDMPIYKLNIPAPNAYISYQFVVEDGKGAFSTSNRFVVKRPCIPELKILVPDDAPDASFRKEVGELYVKAKELERDTHAYESALQLAAELKDLMRE